MNFKFGKYKGVSVEDVYKDGDTDYLEWFLENITGNIDIKIEIESFIFSQKQDTKLVSMESEILQGLISRGRSESEAKTLLTIYNKKVLKNGK